MDPNEPLLQINRRRCSVVERYLHEFISPFERSIFPIFQRISDGTTLLAGTGLFVAPSGIFVSAAHVFEIDVNIGDGFTILCVDSEGRIQELEIEKIKIRPEGKDIALGKVMSGDLQHPIVSIMESLPEVNEVMASAAYSYTLVHLPEKQDGELIQRVRVRSHWEMGKVEEVAIDGFWQTPGPAFRSTILVEGRASGGPVLNSNGFVVGINSRGMAPPNDVPYSVATSIKGLGQLEFDGISIQDRRAGLANRPIAKVQRLTQEC